MTSSPYVAGVFRCVPAENGKAKDKSLIANVRRKWRQFSATMSPGNVCINSVMLFKDKRALVHPECLRAARLLWEGLGLSPALCQLSTAGCGLSP